MAHGPMPLLSRVPAQLQPDLSRRNPEVRAATLRSCATGFVQAWSAFSRRCAVVLDRGRLDFLRVYPQSGLRTGP